MNLQPHCGFEWFEENESSCGKPEILISLCVCVCVQTGEIQVVIQTAIPQANNKFKLFVTFVGFEDRNNHSRFGRRESAR